MNLDRLKASLRAHEAVRRFAYDDKTGLAVFPGRLLEGNLTIGVGRNLTAVGLSVPAIEYLLNEDVLAATAWLDAQLPWWRTLDDVRARVFAELAFNLGPKLLTFKDALFAAETRQFDAASVALLDSLWARQVGARANRLAAQLRDGKD